MNYRTGFALAVLSLFVGCGGDDGRMTVYPVDATLTLDGKPFGPTTVMFNTTDKEKGKSAQGQVDASGKITFTTYEIGDGIPAGNYMVNVGMDFAAPPEPFPAIYRDAEGSPLMVDIKPEEDQKIEVTMDSKIGGAMYKGPSFDRGKGPDMSQPMQNPAFGAGVEPDSE